MIIFVLLGGYPPFDDDDQKVLFHLISTCSYEFHQEFWADISDAAKVSQNHLSQSVCQGVVVVVMVYLLVLIGK